MSVALAASAGCQNGVSAPGSNPSARAHDTSRTVARWTQQGLRVQQHTRADTDCAAHSYGQVRTYVRSHPCSALFRAYFEVRDSRNDVALVAVAWVDMPTAAQAGDLQRLVDTGGTGNLTELSREQGSHQGVRFTGEHYASTLDGVTVVNAQAEPAGGSPDLATIVGTALG